MKNLIFSLSATLLLTSCAGVHVSDTQVASGAANPEAIYIRPFDVGATQYVGNHRGGIGERPIRQSLAGREFADDLKQELERLAPSRVIEHNEVPTVGWLVEGSLDVVDGGHPNERGVVPLDKFGFGKSNVAIHVVISKVGGGYVSTDKDANKLGQKGRVIYEFDLVGGSRGSGHDGSIYSPGLGRSEPFDFRNAAERVMMAMSTDPHKYGVHSSPVIR